MNLYIQIENGQPINHPAFEQNLIEAFGEIPSNWEAFIRVERPTPTIYQVFDNEETIYAKVNGVWTDVWSLRDMTEQEVTAKQQGVIDEFNSREQAENWSAWVLDQATCVMRPPIQRPQRIEGKNVFWCGAENNWKEAPQQPVDNNQYKFDFFAWQWIQVVN
jgi:hypothetical protein